MNIDAEHEVLDKVLEGLFNDICKRFEILRRMALKRKSRDHDSDR